MCDLEFREVVRLEDVDSVTPAVPIMVLEDGRYVTTTYSPGEIAFWEPEGTLLGVVRNGPGEGPGEFDYAADLAQVANGEFVVLTGEPVVNYYSTSGRFLRSIRLPTPSGSGSAVTYGDLAITWGVTSSGARRGFVLRGDGIGSIEGLGTTRWTRLRVAAAEGVGIWSAEHDRYVLRKHALPDGAAEDSLVVARDWFPGPEDNRAEILSLHADGRGLIWTVTGVADPDAPARRQPTGEEQPVVDTEETRAAAAGLYDVVVEALTPDGRLVASARYDVPWDAPLPVHGNIWSRETEDMLSIVVLEAVLIERR